MAALIYMLAAMFAQVVEKMPVKQQGKRPALRKQVASWGLPPLWVSIVVGCLCATAAKDLYGVEIFAGAKAVANGFHDAGLLCATIELNDGDDITITACLKLTNGHNIFAVQAVGTLCEGSGRPDLLALLEVKGLAAMLVALPTNYTYIHISQFLGEAHQEVALRSPPSQDDSYWLQFQAKRLVVMRGRLHFMKK